MAADGDCHHLCKLMAPVRHRWCINDVIGGIRNTEQLEDLHSVKQLKDVIERSCGIPVDKQVLLVSGGESLDPTARVCSYSAGTDTNPIYLFSKSTIESTSPPSLSVDFGPDVALKDQVEATHSMPDTYKTVVARVQLAQQFCDHAREQTRACESLVHDQHLQQQGWAAVLANLEDITQAFRTRSELFEQSFNQHLETRAEYMKLLDNFRDDMDMLSKIPLIPALLETAEDGMDTTVVSSDSKKTSQFQEGGEVTRSVKEGDNTQQQDLKVDEGDRSLAEQQNGGPVTLLQWISANNQNSLYQVAQLCIRSLEQFDENVIEALKAEVDQVLNAAVRTEMKEIKGLEERLYGLEQLMVETKRIVQEQSDLTQKHTMCWCELLVIIKPAAVIIHPLTLCVVPQSFLSNQTRANVLGDASILPDLCASHRRQLLVMLSNHQHLLDIRARCTRAKEELCQNLHMRLKWVMYVENMMCDVGNRLMIYHEKLKRLRRHLDVIQQIHLSPQMYVNAVGEVVRRRTFSQAFLLWASDLACQLLAVHNEEVARRKDFQSQFEGHFLNTLFPGMEDLPPPFATQAPSPFDLGLPKSYSDLKDEGYIHEVVNHSIEFVYEDDRSLHTQKVEQMWKTLKSVLKREGKESENDHLYVFEFLYREQQKLKGMTTPSEMFPQFLQHIHDTYPDYCLLQLTIEDIDRLQAQLPELMFSISGPDLETITQFFLVKSVTGTLKTEDKEDTAALEDRLVKVVTDAGLASHLDPTLLQPAEGETPAMGQSPSPISLQGTAPTRDQDRGFESETDTEEFEKVGQSPVELAFDAKPSAGGSVCISGQAVGRAQEPDGTPSTLATLEVGVCGSGVDSSSPPPTSPLLPHQQQQSHSEFTTADFYIDESMPSSYTESNSARCHHQAAPELIRQLEDTNTLVTLLQVQNQAQSLACKQNFQASFRLVQC
ncbi:hypothetical protein ANN_12057 [Periplaneta americana]|uniref:Autophagy protein ATG17-like domain-containing protein n=1 Tax=Periplaneta americana TaxID=6978 RepID=A0ABQ8T7Y0_PERAM|nr:hypothetical protein ANN_12057 [Periplaneta americana]